MGHQDRVLVNKILIEFKRQGIALSGEEIAKVKKLEDEINELSRQGNTNIAEDETKLNMTKKELVGIPDELMDKLQKVPNTTDSKFISLSYPELYPALDTLENETMRMNLAIANDRKAIKNEPIIERIISIRNELAHIRGYKSYSEYALELLMTKTPSTVEKFIDDLTSEIHEKGEQEMKVLIDLKRKHTKNESAEFHSWDFAYYDNLLKKQHEVDEQVIKQYFPVDHVVDATFNIYQELLGLKFEKAECSVWHEDVQCFKVFDKESNGLLGQFYLDLYPREGKYDHAACFTLVPRHEGVAGL